MDWIKNSFFGSDKKAPEGQERPGSTKRKRSASLDGTEVRNYRLRIGRGPCMQEGGRIQGKTMDFLFLNENLFPSSPLAPLVLRQQNKDAFRQPNMGDEAQEAGPGPANGAADRTGAGVPSPLRPPLPEGGAPIASTSAPGPLSPHNQQQQQHQQANGDPQGGQQQQQQQQQQPNGTGNTPGRAAAAAVGAGDPPAPPARQVGAYTQRELWLQQQEQKGELRFVYIKNDGDEQHNRWMVDLKNIYSRQLPNMPKEYIARLVLDRRHRSVAIVKRNGQVRVVTVA
jgi:hypothetical protein